VIDQPKVVELSNMRESVRRKQFWILAAVASVGLASVAAADTSRTEIVAGLAKVQAALTRGDSAEKISRMLYSDDVLMIEPGNDPPSRGIQSAIAGVQAWMDSLGAGGVKACSYKVIDPVVSSEKTFSSFLQMYCKANGTTNKEDMNLRLMYVWAKRPEGWRVVLESVNEGKF
jgi:ketosteroid isomerase-like protein